MSEVADKDDADSTLKAKTKTTHKRIYLVRHAQGIHNLKYKNHAMPDPLLTAKGLRQCEELASSFPAAEAQDIELIAVSPLRRTVYTALRAFVSVISRGVRIIALPEAQETGAGLKPCDTGSDVQVLESEFAAWHVDWSLLLEGWNASVEQRASGEELERRALYVRRWLRARDEESIVLVTHGGFLHYLTQDFSDFDESRRTGWANCEWRRYEFERALDVSDENATLVRC